MVQSYMKPFIIFLFSFPLSTCFPLFFTLFFYQFLSPLYFCWTFASLRFWWPVTISIKIRGYNEVLFLHFQWHLGV